jgi:hypothetical protein
VIGQACSVEAATGVMTGTTTGATGTTTGATGVMTGTTTGATGAMTGATGVNAGRDCSGNRELDDQVGSDCHMGFRRVVRRCPRDRPASRRSPGGSTAFYRACGFGSVSG